MGSNPPRPLSRLHRGVVPLRMKTPALNGVMSTMILLAAGAPGDAQACSCLPGSLTERFEDADAVFLATLVDEQADFQPQYPLLPVPWYESPGRWLHFHVITSWRGVVGEEVGVVTDAGGSFLSCGFFGTVGDNYLIFGYIDPQHGRLSVSGCSGFAEQYAADDIVQLGEVANPLELVPGDDPQFPSIVGRVGPLFCGAGGLAALACCFLSLVCARAVRRTG